MKIDVENNPSLNSNKRIKRKKTLKKKLLENPYIKLENKDDFKALMIKIRWIFSHSKPVIPYLIFSITLNVIFALIGIYNVVVSKALIDSAISGSSSDVIKWLTVMIGISLFSMVISPATSFLSTHSSTKLSQGIQRKIYKHIEYSSWLEQSKIHSVSLLTRITSDVGNISSTILGTIPSLVSLIVTLVGSFYTLIKWAPSIAFVAVFIGPFLVIIGRIFSKKLKNIYKEAQEEDVKYRSFMQESMQNIMIIKTFCMEKINMKRLEEIQENKYHIAMKSTKLSVMTSMSMSFCSSLAYFTIFSWGVLNIAKGTATYGTFTGMLQLYGKVQGPFSSLASMIPGLIGTIAAAERLMEIEALPLEKIGSSKNIMEFTRPDIKLTNITFAYKENNNILTNLDLTIPNGETIAFVGPSGEGKTTIIRLILSLINANEGQVILKENDLTAELTRDHRELISYVPQGNTLFSGTIRDNLKYGNPETNDGTINVALESACALDFVEELPDGLDTALGERGVGISEGQAQRIAIARSFLRERPILILDEATSSLDPETEVKVLKSIKSLKAKPTCIIITHRPSALSICNRIIRLEKGSIREVSKESIYEVASELV
ncbi:MAG: ABC transporter ATP-binding protein [Clostridium sp.]